MNRSYWLATAFALTAAPAFAQPAPPQKPDDKAPPTVKEITIEGTAPPVKTSIDRKSYSVSNDLQATTGSISDALRNVPSLEVDVQGNVSLRGDPNVTILIDGKPSGMFKGEGKAQALQNLPATQIERVEVITNPSAAFNPEGTAGIINLVTKKTAKPGVSGGARINLGSSGRQNGGVNGSYKRGDVTVTGDASIRHDSLKQVFTTDRAFLDPAGGGFDAAHNDASGSGSVQVASGRVGVDYDPDAKTRISAELRYLGVDFDIQNVTVRDQFGPGSAPLLAYNRNTDQRQARDELEATLSYRRTFAENHQLDLSFSRERDNQDRSTPALTHLRFPAGPDSYLDQEYRWDFWRTQVKADYAVPLGGAKLKVGYAFDADDDDFNLVSGRSDGSGPVVIDPNQTNLFKFDQQVHAGYFTYERPIGKLTALAGLRVETTLLDFNQVTQGLKSDNDYTRAYPSLHLGYKLDDDQQLSASYSRRIQRPNSQDYNPFVVVLGPTDLRSGNPDLKPQETDSFELGYQYRHRGTTYLATAYYRDGRDSVTDVTRDLGDGLFLTTKENLGSFKNAGLELVANGRWPHGLSYNLSANLAWSEVDGTPLGFGGKEQSAFTGSGRGSLSWQATPKDFLQLNALVNGKKLTAQGYMEPTGMLNLGYRHKFGDALSGVVTVQDVLDSFRFRTRIDTPELQERVRGEMNIRGVFVGLSYTFGGGRQREGFDFGGGGPPS